MNFDRDVTARLIESERQIDRLKSFSAQATIANAMGFHQGLPGLVGFWPVSSVQRSTGNVYDLSGQDRTLTYNGNPTFNLYNSVVPYADLDGTGDYLSRADETDLDILGTETIFASGVRGLTLGGWFWLDAFGAVTRLIGKENNAAQLSYLLYASTGGSVTFTMSNTGAAFAGSVSASGIVTGRWYDLVGRFTPGLETAIFVDGVKTINNVSIPASIFNSTAALTIGSQSGGGNYLDGRATLCFLSANALPDALIEERFQRTRGLFGV